MQSGPTGEIITAFLEGLFHAAVAAADPEEVLVGSLPEPGSGRTVVIGAGKASARMARMVEEYFPGDVTGTVVTRYGHGEPCHHVEVLEAGHPVPDDASVIAAGRILDAVCGLGPADLVLCLLSGGGSALLTLPEPGLTLADKQETTRALLRTGASIREINCVRKHLSRIKGGWLAAAAAPARIVTLAISDVPGDEPSEIASGPTTADPSTFEQAREVLSRYPGTLPESVVAHLQAGRRETPKPGDPRLERAEFRLVAKARFSLETAAVLARMSGVEPFLLGDDIQGEARMVGNAHAAIALQIARGTGPVKPPCVILSGGETTVRVRGTGRGGNNTEFLLALGVALQGHPGISAIACDTDGIDGTEDNAGAVLFPDTLTRAETAGLDADASLDQNDSYGFFDALGDLVVTGPTGTNVSDFRAIYVGEDNS